MDVIASIVLAVVVGSGVTLALWRRLRLLHDQLESQEKRNASLRSECLAKIKRVRELETELVDVRAERDSLQARNQMLCDLGGRTP